jgi:hypothetical protein
LGAITRNSQEITSTQEQEGIFLIKAPSIAATDRARSFNLKEIQLGKYGGSEKEQHYSSADFSKGSVLCRIGRVLQG